MKDGPGWSSTASPTGVARRSRATPTPKLLVSSILQVLTCPRPPSFPTSIPRPSHASARRAFVLAVVEKRSTFCREKPAKVRCVGRDRRAAGKSSFPGRMNYGNSATDPVQYHCTPIGIGLIRHGKAPIPARFWMSGARHATGLRHFLRARCRAFRRSTSSPKPLVAGTLPDRCTPAPAQRDLPRPPQTCRKSCAGCRGTLSSGGGAERVKSLAASSLIIRSCSGHEPTSSLDACDPQGLAWGPNSLRRQKKAGSATVSIFHEWGCGDWPRRPDRRT